MSKKAIILILIVLIAISIILLPAAVFAFQGQPEKFDYYVKALEYMYKGFIAYLQKVFDLFKAAIGG